MKRSIRARSSFLISIITLISSLPFLTSANAITVSQVIWRNPPAGSMTSSGTFTPSIDGVTGGVMRSMSSTFNFASNVCSDNWSDLANAATINLENGKCYKWTMDPTVDSSSVKPNEKVTDQSSLTSGVLKVSDSACHMNSEWDGSVVTITYGLPNPSSGIDCKTEFTTPKNVGKIDYLLVGGGGAGGWASTVQSQGGGGGGGGGTSFSSINASVTPGRTYAIQVGAGAIVGTRNDGGSISCLRGEVGNTSTSVQASGGTSKLGKFIAEGGGCAEDTGGIERGSDGGISANGRTGGRGGSCYSRHGLVTYEECLGKGFPEYGVDLPSTTFYTTGPNVKGLNAWEGAGGGGGASYSDDPNSSCNYGNPNWNFYTGCDGWDIGGVGAFGGIGGAGISSWYAGACNYYFGGGGGGGGSTPLANSDVAVRNDGQVQLYTWNGSANIFSNSPNPLKARNWMPLGGHGGIGGGGHAATSTTNWSENAPGTANYLHAQNGVDGCGGGGGGGQANKRGAYKYSATYATTSVYDSYGDQVYDLNGTQYFASRDNSGNRIQVLDETLPGQCFYYKASNDPNLRVIADDYGYIYTYARNNFSNIGNGDGNGTGDPFEFTDVDDTLYTLNPVYQVGSHTFQVSTPLTTNDHYLEYVDQNGIVGYLDYVYLDIFINGGYSSTDFMQQATQEILISSAEPTAQTLDEPGKGGNGLVAIRFSLTSNYGSEYNPALKVPTVQKVWPTLNDVVVPISLKQSGGSGYVCISLANPSNPSTDYSGTSSIRVRLGETSSSSLSISEAANVLVSKLAALNVGKSIQENLIRDRDPWVASKYLILRISYSGSDSIATNSCDNSTSDFPVGGTPLVQYVKLERIPATQVRSMTILPKNGRQNN